MPCLWTCDLRHINSVCFYVFNFCIAVLCVYCCFVYVWLPSGVIINNNTVLVTECSNLTFWAIIGRIAVLRRCGLLLQSTDGVAWSVGRSVGLSVTTVSPAKTAEPIEMLLGMLSRVCPENHVLDRGAHWRHLANTIEPSVCAAAMRPYVKLL